jgi:hypothetical protein
MAAKTNHAPLSDPAIRRLLVVALPIDAWCVWNAFSGDWSWLPAAFAMVVTVSALAELWPRAHGIEPVSLDDGAMRPPPPRTGERLLWRGIRAMRMADASGTRRMRESRSAPLTVRGRATARPEGQPADVD